MLQGDQSTTDLGRCDFGVVQRDDHREGTNTKTCDESTGENVVIVASADDRLDNDTDDEEGASNDDRELSTEFIGRVTIGKHTDPGTEFQDRGEKTGQRRVTDTVRARGDTKRVHRQDLPKHSLVVTVDQTSHRGKHGNGGRSRILDESSGSGLGSERRSFLL